MAKKPANEAASKSGREKSTARSRLIEEVQELVEIMSANDLSKIDVQDGEHKIMLERAAATPQAPVAMPVAPTHSSPAAPGAPAPEAEAAPDQPPAEVCPTLRLSTVITPSKVSPTVGE